MIKKPFLYNILFLTLFIFSCQEDDSGTPILMAEDGEELSGGDFTIFNASANAFGFAGTVLSIPDRQRFGVGNSLFNQNWVTAPASTTARDGVGPFFNARACSTCHFKDGRGRPPMFNGEFNHGLLLRLSTGTNSPTMGNTPHPIYGGQLQDQAILGQIAEGGFDIEYTTITGTYADGTTYTLQKPNYTLTNLAYGDIGSVSISPRVGPPVIGLGLIDAISDQDILANQDINDSNNDGISGRANFVWNQLEQQITLGKYGWKANQPTIDQQNGAAFNGDLGITNPIFPNENCPVGVDCDAIPNGGNPEIPQETFDLVNLYIAGLAVPVRRDWEEQNVLRGKQLFNNLQCASCHIPQFTTTSSNFASELENQIIRPYTDLLLHDMGAELADDTGEFLATNQEWRTPPLWGIGLTQTVSGHTNFLHDGRARNLEEAILWHGGEAENSKNMFTELSATQRQDLLDFLNSL